MPDEHTPARPETPDTTTPDTGAAAAPAPVDGEQAQPAPRRRRRAASRPSGPPPEEPAEPSSAPEVAASAEAATSTEAAPPAEEPPKRRRRATKKAAAAPAAAQPAGALTTTDPDVADDQVGDGEAAATRRTLATAPFAATAVLFQPPDPTRDVPSRATAAIVGGDDLELDEPAPRRRRAAKRSVGAPTPAADADASPDASPDAAAAGAVAATADPTQEPAAESEAAPDTDAEGDEAGTGRRRRRRGGRGRRRRADDADEQPETTDEGVDGAEPGAAGGDGATSTTGLSDEGAGPASAARPGSADGSGAETGEEPAEGGTRRRRRRRRRTSDSDDTTPRPDDPPDTVVRVRERRAKSDKAKASDKNRDDDEVTAIKGSTRMEAKRQRRRDGREAGRRRPPVLSEAEFLARREAVDRVMVVRQRGERTQIGVLEDGVLVEHYIGQGTQGSSVGNVYLGRVQNVLPSMEAAFVDIGKGRNAVLYAGEVDWDGASSRRIEDALKSGQSVLVQVTKDPIAHKGARLTSQVSLAGRYLVYAPSGSMNGISRKLPDTERARLKQILKAAVPDEAGVIVRTAAEGASEDELTRDVTRLQAQWADIDAKAGTASAPALLYAEPDLTVKVVRDLFNEDFSKLVVSGAEAWETIEQYVTWVAPSLADRLHRWTADEDVFAAHRIDEQLTKALDRKVWLPSGGSLVIDRTEAMTVVDVNTGKFTGSGGNLEETVTRNNLEAAEEIVRQLRLRDIGGIIVVDFIDMVLEANRDLVLRRLVECLGRDRTKHQVAEVTSLGLVQMTRKRIGMGLLEVFGETCEACNGRGVKVRLDEVSGTSKGRRRGGPELVAAATRRGDAAVAADGESAAPPAGQAVTGAAPDVVADAAGAAVDDEEPAPGRRRRRSGRAARRQGPPDDSGDDAPDVPSPTPAADVAAEPAGV